jgi:hypothetical protein
MTDAVESSPDLKLSRIPEVGTAPIGSAAEIRLAELWESAPGWRGWLSTVDHKEIGLRYLVTAFIFLLMGGIEALIILKKSVDLNPTENVQHKFDKPTGGMI